MEHILISPGKLKLMLTRNDMEHYELNSDALNGGETVRRGALSELLNDIKTISGFDAADDKVFIQLYPSKDGGAELYITRLSARGEDEGKGKGTVRLVRVYAFADMTSLLRGCARLGRSPDECTVSAWYGEQGYFLVCDYSMTYRSFLRSERFDGIRELIGDCGRLIDDSAAHVFVKERCECFVTEKAVEVLGKLA